MGSIMRGLGALAGGFGEGYFAGKEKARQNDIEERKLKLEEKRQALENKKLQNESDMLDKLHSVDQEVKPAQVFVVQTADGQQQIYADQKLAQQAVAQDPSAQILPKFVAGGKTFDDKDSAMAAAESMNAPAARLRRRAQVYQAYGREDLANAAMQTYRLQMDNNRREIQQQFLAARQTGDVAAVVEAYNNQLPNGLHAQLVQGQNGQPMVQITRGGQPVGQPQPFDWEAMQQQVMATPDNMVEIWRTNQDLKLRKQLADSDTRRTDAAVRQTDAQVRHLDAQTADIPNQAADRRTQAQASATSAGAAATNARTGAMQLTRPTVSAVPDAKGGLNFVTVPQAPNAAGQWTMGKPQVAPAGGGLQYPAGYVAGQRNALGGLGLGMGLAPAQPDPTVVQSVLQQMEEEARKRAAARGKGPAVSGQVEY